MNSLFSSLRIAQIAWKAAGLILALAAVSSPDVSHARALGDISLHVSSQRTDDGASGATSDRRFRLNLAMGWLSELNRDEVDPPSQLLGYGLIVRTERGFQSSSELAGFGLGLFLGYYAGPFSVRIDYFALSELKSNNGIVETAFREGSGYAVNLRWLHWFESINDGKNRVGVGPSLSYEQTTYSKSRVGSLPESNASRTADAISPGVVGLFYF